jgi:dipeptidyl aminopeptidase/acylaminoacyl peptidase
VLWQAWLYLLEPGNTPQRLTDDSFRPYLGFPFISRHPEIRWTEDDRVVLLGESRGESFLYQVSITDFSARHLLGGGWQSTAVSLDSAARKAVVLSASWRSPGDLYQLSLDTQEQKQLTDYNYDYLAEHPPAQMEKFNVRRDSWNIECRLFLPPEFDPTKQYPLVLDIHGGPNGAFYDSFVPWQQVLATSGYLVLAANPRGSSTYGNEFMMAVLGDWGGADYLDLMAAVDQVSARPYVDQERLGVHGYSYGGYMTSWIVGQTSRFKAAVVGAPCINLHSMYGTSDIGVSFGEVQWGNSPAEVKPEDFGQMWMQLLQRSPITYAPRVETPVLLLHGESDARCPISQSEEYFVLLKRLGKEVELVRFPGCSHLFPRLGPPLMREEYLDRTLGWFNKHLS